MPRAARPRARRRRVAPPQLTPMMALLGSLPRGGGWGYEFKWDGYRALAAFDGVDLRLTSRNGNDLTDRFPEIAPLARALRRPCLLDGELVAMDENGRPSFSLMQTRMPSLVGGGGARLAASMTIAFLVFDLPWHDGEDLCPLPYVERRERLASLALSGDAWRVPGSHDDGAALMRLAREHGLEGVVAKRLDSPYRPGRRSGEWIKTKILMRDEFVVGGYALGTDERSLGALLLGYHDAGGALRFAGKVGTGFSVAVRRHLQAELDAHRRDVSPFADLKRMKNAVWSEPRVVAEVAYTEWTHDGSLRHPSFQGLRTDKTPAQVADPRGR